MGRYVGPKCKQCRREGVKLFLKGDRCFTAKCAVDKDGKTKPPGMHSWRNPKLSEYGKRLREKQKLKRHYGLFDKQFKQYFKLAEKETGNTGENFLVTLERRLDNVVYRAGYAHSRSHARQLINHGHFLVNGQKVDIPSYLITQGEEIAPASRESTKKIMEGVKQANKREVPSWIEEVENGVKVVNLPVRDEVQIDVQDQYIVEFFSR